MPIKKNSRCSEESSLVFFRGNKKNIVDLLFEMSKESVRIILPKYYTFINDTSFGCIYTHSLL